MFGILLSAFNSTLGWIFRSIVIKFGVFFALYFIATGFIGLVTQLIPSPNSLNGVLAGITSGTWYFLDAFKLPQGLSMVLAAYATRFLIRRIPVIG